MDCADTTTRFSDYYDGGLLPAERAALEEHLKGCSSCTGEYRHFSDGLHALHETQPLETTDIFLPTIRAAAQAHLTRREQIARPSPTLPPAGTETTTEALTVRTPTLGSPSPVPSIPVWVPWSLAGTMLVSFVLGWVAFGRTRPSGEVEGLRGQVAALEAKLARKPATVE